MYCRNCGKELGSAAAICVECGVAPPNGASFCNGCGAPTSAVAEICVKCGARLARRKKTRVSPKSRLAATLLCVLPGFFLALAGIHRLYLGKIGTGVTMLVLSILGWLTIWLYGLGLIFWIPAWIWSLIDFIFAVSGQMRDGKGKLVTNW